MELITFIVIGVVTALNIMFVKMKLNRARYEDAALDVAILLGLAFIFSGSFGGLVVATVTSLVISIYLFFSPPTLFTKLVSQ